MHEVLTVVMLAMVILAGLSAVRTFLAMNAILAEARKIPNLPANVRVNPINILANRNMWTPALGESNARLNVAGAWFVGSCLVGLTTGLLRALL